jgi:hypothetical protein
MYCVTAVIAAGSRYSGFVGMCLRHNNFPLPCHLQSNYRKTRQVLFSAPETYFSFAVINFSVCSMNFQTPYSFYKAYQLS